MFRKKRWVLSLLLGLQQFLELVSETTFKATVIQIVSNWQIILSNCPITMKQLSNTGEQRFKLLNNCPLVCCVTIFRLECGQHSWTHPRLCSGLNGRRPLLPKDMSSFLQMVVNSLLSIAAINVNVILQHHRQYLIFLLCLLTQLKSPQPAE